MVGDELRVLGIKKFDDTNFGYRMMQIEDYLFGKKLHLALLGQKQEKMDDSDWNLLDQYVLGFVRLTPLRSVAHNVINEKTTVDLVAAFSSMYEKKKSE